MKNLFVLHTQYNLILSLALILEKHQNDENHLILFKDFKLSEEMLQTLQNQFSSVKVCTGFLNVEDRSWKKKAARYRMQKAEFEADNRVYDNVYLVEDTVIPEQYIMRHSYRKNKNVRFSYIGDGGDAYYTIIDPKKLTGISRHGYLIAARKIVFKYGLGLGRFYHHASCFGSSPILTDCYELFPMHLRQELQKKNKHEIKGEYLIQAAKLLYSHLTPPVIEENALVIMMDKLTVYGDFKLFDRVTSELIEKAGTEGRKIYYKYHPVETQIYPKAENWIELDRTLPAEFMLSCADPNKTWVVGIMTTALQAAKKMGHNVTSYIESFAPEREEVIELYKKIGIDVR